MVSFYELQENFSSSQAKDTLRANELIKEYLDTKGITMDGNMINLSTLPILLSNVLSKYKETQIMYHISYQNDTEYIVKISIY
jgi:hypothetical protein